MHPALLLCAVFSPGSSSEPEGGPDPRCSRAPVFLPHPLSAVDLLLQSARPGDAHGLLPLLTRPLCWARAVPGAGSEASGRREPLPAPHTPSSEGPGRPTCRAVLAETRRAGRCFQYLGGPLPGPASLGVLQAPARPPRLLEDGRRGRCRRPHPTPAGSEARSWESAPHRVVLGHGKAGCRRSRLTKVPFWNFRSFGIQLDASDAYFPH